MITFLYLLWITYILLFKDTIKILSTLGFQLYFVKPAWIFFFFNFLFLWGLEMEMKLIHSFFTLSSKIIHFPGIETQIYM